MNDIRQRLNLIYIGVTVAAVVLAAAMIVGYAGNRRAEEAETTKTVTSRTEKEKRDRVMISTNTEKIGRAHV